VIVKVDPLFGTLSQVHFIVTILTVPNRTLVPDEPAAAAVSGPPDA
jgi:hypothetical protein